MLRYVSLVFLVACGAQEEVEILSDWGLSLQPRALDDAIFEENRDIEVVLWNGDGTIDILNAGTSSQGVLTLDNQPPIEDTRIGLLVEASGGTAGQYDPDNLITYREVGPFTLSTGGESIEQPLILAPAYSVGPMSILESQNATFYGASVMVPGGDVLIFGGTPNLGDGDKRILRLSDVDGSDWVFSKVSNIPDDNPAGGDVLGLTATLVEDGDGTPLVFVAGGRGSYDDPTTGTAQSFLYDPALDEVVWNDGDLDTERSQHVAQVMDNGKVILAGGYLGETADLPEGTSCEIFDPDDKSNQRCTTPLETGSIGVGVANLGAGGALVCGGSALQLDTNDVEFHRPIDACNRVTLSGEPRSADNLPDALSAFAMASLGDGRILVAGGLSQLVFEPGNPANTVPAETSTYVYDPGTDSWASAPDMTYARAHARAIPLPDGRVMVVGGVEQGSTFFGAYEDPVACAEVFDGSTMSWEITNCSQTGSGAHPLVASSERDGAFVLTGIDDNEQGGDEFGWVSFGPSGL